MARAVPLLRLPCRQLRLCRQGLWGSGYSLVLEFMLYLCGGAAGDSGNARMTVNKKLLLILTATAAGPLALSAALGGVHLSSASAALVAAAAAAVIWGFLTLLTGRIIRPVDNMLSGVRGFIGSGYHLDAVIPPAGWPELKCLADDLNRMMLELQAFRAFHLSQVMEEKNKAQALIDAITDGLLLMDDRGGLIYANPVALELLGVPVLSPEAVLPGAITNGPFQGAFAAIISSAEQFVRSEITSGPCPSAPERQTAVLRNYRIIARRFPLQALKRQGCVVVMRDITSERELEKAKEAFFRMITHDMRSPLATIQGYAEIIMRKLGPDSGNEKFFQNILYSARRLGGMIDDIMNITRLQSGSLSLVPSNISANDLVTRLKEEQEPATAPKQITVACETEPQAPIFRGDMALLQRVLANLAGHAIRSTPKGGTITFGAGQDAENVLFWVRDTGPALSEEKRRTLFDEYLLAGKHGGLGHLAMCKMLVELHSGRIWAESEDGKGNRIVFTVSKTSALKRADDNLKCAP